MATDKEMNEIMAIVEDRMRDREMTLKLFDASRKEMYEAVKEV